MAQGPVESLDHQGSIHPLIQLPVQHPTAEQNLIQTARYRQPAVVWMLVMSPAQPRLTAVGWGVCPATIREAAAYVVDTGHTAAIALLQSPTGAPGITPSSGTSTRQQKSPAPLGLDFLAESS